MSKDDPYNLDAIRVPAGSFRRHIPKAQDILKRTSYPYLWLSREVGVPYGVILKIGTYETRVATGGLTDLGWSIPDRRALYDTILDLDRLIMAGYYGENP